MDNEEQKHFEEFLNKVAPLSSIPELLKLAFMEGIKFERELRKIERKTRKNKKESGLK